MKSENRKVLFIINKFSGVGYSPSLEGKIIETCAVLGLECHLEFTAHRGHATALASEAYQKGFEMVFAVGGDGTVNEVAKALAQGTIPLGILPKGSGNGLARHLGIPTNFEKALALVKSSALVRMDTFLFNGHLSVNVSGIGFDGYIAGMFGKNGKRGLFNYLRLIITEFKRFNEFDVTLRLDHETIHRKAFMVVFANSSQFGNNARVAPRASVRDGWIDVIIIKKIPLLHILGFGIKLFSGTVEQSPFAEVKRTRKIDIHFAQPMPCHVDGEALESTTDFSVTIMPEALPVLVPSITADRV